MKDFLEDGNLFPGIHTYTVSDFEEQFVHSFPTSQTRKEIYHNFQSWLEILEKIATPYSIWLDGSYLTTKLNPNDMDIVIFYRPEDIDTQEKANKIQEIVHNNSQAYNCDAYICLELDHLDPQIAANYGNGSIMKKYWMGQFTFDRERNPKGLVEFNRNEISNCIGGDMDDIATGTDK